MKKNYLFTSESVSEGHPDKVCDRISDAIVDAYLNLDSNSRVAVETLTTTNRIVIAGEVRGADSIKKTTIEELARNAVKDIGYEQEGFHWRNAEVAVHIHQQSADIAQGVDSSEAKDLGAGDQGIMFGYACKETEVLMPAAIHYSHRILEKMALARHADKIKGLGPDSKSQVTLRYEDGKPVGAQSVVVSTQHDAELDQQMVREIVYPFVVSTLPDGWMCADDELYVNPTGRLLLEDQMEMLDSQAGRLLSILTVELPLMEAERFLGKIQQKLIDLPLMLPAISQKMSLQPRWPIGVLYNWPMR